jgi:hypothetical protein
VKLETTNDVLVLGPDFKACEEHACRFFSKTPLVRYESVHVEEEKSFSAADPLFWKRVDKGIANNRKALEGLLSELKGYGFVTLDDILYMEQGFQSKILHTAAHLLDGFIGIDTCFYSLAHDSHWLSEAQRNEIEGTPNDYWLLHIKGEITIKSAGKPSNLRSFEN